MMTLLYVVGGYVVTSLILFKYPQLIHKKKEMKFCCRHISHRGGAAENLENTIKAFEHAVKTGTDMLEIDVHLTRDGQVVIFHDENLQRVTGVNAKIADLSYNELPRLKPSLCFGQDFKGSIREFSDEDKRIPLLSELFAKFPLIPINLDIKTNNDELIKKVSNMISEYEREDFTVWGNSNDVVTKKCYKENPRIPLLFSLKRVMYLIVWTYSGLLPFISIRESCFEILMPSAFMNRAVVGKKAVTRALLWTLEKLLMRKAIFEHLHKRGIQTYLWVLNDESEFTRAFNLKATGVMTDYPTRLRAFLDQNPHYCQINKTK